MIFTEKEKKTHLTDNNYYQLDDKQKRNLKYLNNMYRFYSLIDINIPAINYKKRTLDFTYVRYADEWIFLTNSNENIALEIKNKIANFLLSELGLTLSESKTKINNISKRTSQPAKFLGFALRIIGTRKIVKFKTTVTVGSQAGTLILNQTTIEFLIGSKTIPFAMITTILALKILGLLFRILK